MGLTSGSSPGCVSLQRHQVTPSPIWEGNAEEGESCRLQGPPRAGKAGTAGGALVVHTVREEVPTAPQPAHVCFLLWKLAWNPNPPTPGGDTYMPLPHLVCQRPELGCKRPSQGLQPHPTPTSSISKNWEEELESMVSFPTLGWPYLSSGKMSTAVLFMVGIRLITQSDYMAEA